MTNTVPPPSVPIAGKNGLVSVAWYNFFRSALVGGLVIEGAQIGAGIWLPSPGVGITQKPFVIGNTVYSETGHNGAEMGFEVWTRNPVSGAYIRNMACHVGDVNDNVVTVFYKHVDFKGILEYHSDLGEELNTRFEQATANAWENNWINRQRTQNCAYIVDIHKDGGTFKIRKNTTNDTAGGTEQTRGYADWSAGTSTIVTVNAATNTTTFAGPIVAPSYTVANLPASPGTGAMAFATNCRMFNGAGVQEGAGAGTGGLVTYNGSAWKIAGTNVTAVA